MREDLEPTLFCAWCNKELGWGATFVAFTLCKDCIPLVRADFEARREARRAPRADRQPRPRDVSSK